MEPKKLIVPICLAALAFLLIIISFFDKGIVMLVLASVAVVLALVGLILMIVLYRKNKKDQ